jgi:pimeloyl-ACP methyl ester carboxylesterase
MTTYLSSSNGLTEETIYTIDEITGASNKVGSYSFRDFFGLKYTYQNIFFPGFGGIALNSLSDELFVLGDFEQKIYEYGYQDTTYGHLDALPILRFTPSVLIGKFSEVNKLPAVSMFSQPKISDELNSYELGKFTLQKSLTFGNGNLYSFIPSIKTTAHGISIGIAPVTYTNELFKIDPGNISSPIPLAQLPFAINALAYDPTIANNSTIKHRLFATAVGSNGDQLYSIDLDKIGDGLKKIGDNGIGYADINGLVFEKGTIHGFTKTGQEIIIDSLSGEGAFLRNNPIQGQLTGAAASQDKFNIQDKGYIVERELDPSHPSREIHLNLISGGASTTEKWGGGKVWILAHGWNSDPETFKDLVTAIRTKNPADDIITVDWSDAAKFINAPTPGTATPWIKEVADYTTNELKDWGLKLTDGAKINLIGHSLGTFVSSELAANFSKVDNLIALEPAASLDGSSYDLDGLTPGIQSPKRFDSVANFSRAFEGTQSLATSTDLGRTAIESILIDFGRDLPSPFTEHGEVITAFTSLVNQGLMDAPSLPDNLFSLDDLRENTQFQKNVFTSYGKTSFDGVISVDTSFLPTSFQGVLASGTHDRVIYAANKSTTLRVPVTSADGNKYQLIGGAGDDILIPSAFDPTTLTGGGGKDTFDIPIPSDPSTTIPITEITDFVAGQDTLQINNPNLNSTPDSSLGIGDFGVVDSITSTNPSYSSGSSTSEIIFSQSNGTLYFNPSHTGVQATPFAKLNGINSISRSDIKVSTLPISLNNPNTSTRTDFNGDRKSDILWRNTDGSIAQWQMNGSAVTPIAVEKVTADWTIAGTGDFNGDKKSDILWRNTDGSIATWQMNGGAVTTTAAIGKLTPDWTIASTGDFNGDGNSDILLQNTDGTIATWQMNGGATPKGSSIGTLTSGWSIAGTADFNGDGITDILLRNTDGRIAEWQMNGSKVINAVIVGSTTSDWKIAGTADFNGDGKADILYRNDNGSVAEWQLNGGTITSTSAIGFAPTDWKITETGDYNSDGKADILWRNDLGGVATWQMNGSTILAAGATSIPTAPTSWQIVAPIL